MSLQLRLNILIGALFTIGLAGMIAAMMLDAQPRARAEAESAMHLTESVVRGSLAPISRADNPADALANLIHDLQTLRHVAIFLEGRNSQDSESRPRAPQSAAVAKIPVEIRGKFIDTIIIAPRDSDELSELWDAAARILQYGAAICLCILALTSVVINRALRPVEALRGAMSKLEGGNYAVAIPENGTPEIRGICIGMNTLASKLLKARQENQKLTSHIIHVQDSERREIARELHDELGPCLFSMRTTGTMLEREFAKRSPDYARARRLGRDMAAQIDFLQQTNRRVLQKLTPAGLQELGLQGALSAIVAMWRREQPDVLLQLEIGSNVDELESATELTVYRIIQEGLTNAYRHSGAAQISVTLDIVAKETVAEKVPDVSNMNANAVVNIVVRDNGRGRDQNQSDGFGLTAMRERVKGLGGAIIIGDALGGGAVIDAVLPMSRNAQSNQTDGAQAAQIG